MKKLDNELDRLMAEQRARRRKLLGQRVRRWWDDWWYTIFSVLFVVGLLVGLQYMLRTMRESDRVACEARGGYLEDISGGRGGWVCLGARRPP